MALEKCNQAVNSMLACIGYMPAWPKPKETRTKKIINGVTYNTDTSTAVAKSMLDAEYSSDGKSYEYTLYQTRGGVFFFRHHTTWAVKKDGEWVEREADHFEPMTRDAAQKWVMEGEVDLLAEGVLGIPPEASAEDEPAATIYLRVPEALKIQIERRAKAAQQSMNVWAMRCLEQCALAGEPPKSASSEPSRGGD